MPCTDCEKIRETYPGALCASCAGVREETIRGQDEHRLFLETRIAELEAEVERLRQIKHEAVLAFSQAAKETEQAEAKLAEEIALRKHAEKCQRENFEALIIARTTEANLISGWGEAEAKLKAWANKESLPDCEACAALAAAKEKP